MNDRTGRIAFNLAGTCASVALLLAPFSRSRRTSGSLDDPSGFSTLTTHTEGLRAWAISAFLGAAVALGALLVGWFFTTRDRPTAALGAAICFGAAGVGLGYAAVAAFSRWLVLLEERSAPRLYTDYDLYIAWDLVIVAFVALAGAILSGLLALSWAVASNAKRPAARATSAAARTRHAPDHRRLVM